MSSDSTGRPIPIGTACCATRAGTPDSSTPSGRRSVLRPAGDGDSALVHDLLQYWPCPRGCNLPQGCDAARPKSGLRSRGPGVEGVWRDRSERSWNVEACRAQAPKLRSDQSEASDGLPPTGTNRIVADHALCVEMQLVDAAV
jgi:hypothetical protein